MTVKDLEQKIYKLLLTVPANYEDKELIGMLKAFQLSVRKKALLDASTVVAGHWNSKSDQANQYQQAQRSAEALREMAFKNDN